MNENNNTTQQQGAESRRFRPEFALFKANGKGTGCALKLALHPAHDMTDGSIWATFANQLTIGDRRGPNPTYARFDWDNRICVKLDFADLTRMLQVFRGECESIGDGKGLCHRSPKGMTIIGLRHFVEPVSGYSFEVHRTAANGGEESHAHIFIAPHEAIGLCAAIEGSLPVICFGIPEVIERDTSAYRQGVKEMRNAAVA